MNKIYPLALTTDQMREVDRLMIEDYGISLEQMMENAGRNLADLAIKLLATLVPKKEQYNVVVAGGTGNNGGGGMVAARFMSNYGVNVTVVLAARESSLKTVPAQRWETLKILPVTTIAANSCDSIGVFQDADIILDAVIGYGLRGEINGIPAQVIGEILNSRNLNILSLDIPSGLDSTTGSASGICIRAKATMTLALPKTGIVNRESDKYVGELYLADIGVPPELYTRLGLPPQVLFTNKSVIQLNQGHVSDSR